MASKDEPTRARIDNIKADLRTTYTCSTATITALQELLSRKNDEPVEKENVKAKAQPTARRRAATTAAATEHTKQTAATLSPREKYILATEVANTTLKTLADALKSPPNALAPRPSSQSKTAPNEDARKPARQRAGHAKTASVSKRPLMERSASQMTNSPKKRPIRRSSSYSSVPTSGPDAGLVATAECARTAFAYLGTLEATKVLGKDSQELQLENGILALVGKLVALGLDSLAVKEMRHLKKRLEVYLGQGKGTQRPASRSVEKESACSTTGEKESLASLLHFPALEPTSPAIPIIASLQTYALRTIARLNRPRIVEATYEHLKLSNPSSPANLIHSTATTATSQPKAARQLESLAQTILALCPNISSTHDDKPLQASPETVLLLQHLAFKIRKDWWTLVKHQGKYEQEILEPFSKCIVAFARRSQLSPKKKYALAESLYTDLSGVQQCANATGGAVAMANNTLSSLAQAAGQSEDALRWLGTSKAASPSTTTEVKQTARIVRIATVSIEAFVKGEGRADLQEVITSALEGLGGGLGGSIVDLDALFLEANALRRAAMRLLMGSSLPNHDTDLPSIRRLAIDVIASSVHFTARMAGSSHLDTLDTKAQQRNTERMTMVWKCTKSVIDSVLVCCKEVVDSSDHWKRLDLMLQECSHILHRFEEEIALGIDLDPQGNELVQTLSVKLSNAYWAVHLQLRKAKLSSETIATAMQRSINLIHTGGHTVKEAGHLPMKLESLGDLLESLGSVEKSRKAFGECISAHLESDVGQTLSDAAAKYSIQKIFDNTGPLGTAARVVKSYHRGFIKSGGPKSGETAFFDNPELQPAIRGALLELQLGLYIRTLSKNRHWDSSLDASIRSLVERLQHLYSPKIYPVRNLRLDILLLQVRQRLPHVVPTDMLEFDASEETAISARESKDVGLAEYEAHLKALLSLKTSMNQDTPPESVVKGCLSTWETLLDRVKSWKALVDYVDDIEYWISELQGSVAFLNAKGEEYLALPVLQLLLRVNGMREDPDASDLVGASCALGLQFLRLGYTGKAGLSLARAESVLTKRTISTEAHLQWHIAYSEYLARIGNTAKCASTLSAAHTIASTDQQFMDMAKSSATLSGRLRFNKILADAAYVCSLLATVTGNYKDAARHAKQCVTLNRRIWAALESKTNAKKTAPVDDSDLEDSASKIAFDPLSSLRNDKGAPLVMSVTHDALNGPDFWGLVPALYRGLMQHSQVFAHQGLLQEAIHIAEQAEKIASTLQSPTLMIDNASWRADCWAQSGRPDKAEPLLKALEQYSTRKSLSIVGYLSAVARTQHWNGHFEQELASYKTLDRLLQDLTSPDFMNALHAFAPRVDSLAEQMSNMTINVDQEKQMKVVATRGGRRPAAKAAPRPAPKPATKAAPKARSRAQTAVATKAAAKIKTTQDMASSSKSPGMAEQCSILNTFQAEIMHRSVLANLLQNDLATASAILAQLEQSPDEATPNLSHAWATFKMMLAQSFQEIAENIALNTLPESTIAFPAVNLKERGLSEEVAAKRKPLVPATIAKSARSKAQLKISFAETLRDARDRLREAHAASAVNSPNFMFQQISMALGTITVLLSAVSGEETESSLHPLYAAYMAEIPKCNALRLAHESVEAEKEQLSRDQCLSWPSITSASLSPTTMTSFQNDYVDIIPESWTAVSLALNDTHDELYITRFEKGSYPFVLRLPLARHASRDMDEEEFSFGDGKRDFDEIIELSDFSTRSAKDMTSREARQQWWTEREALDTRLHELLLNMENIWLGGFKGVFSQHERQPSLLARFRKSLENIINQHLPSRRKKSQQKRPVLDARVLDLFIGLGDVTDEELDVDDALMDLLYFVVDILHFNGERNAYDEIDFDAMVVETHEALRAYHVASHHASHPSQHMILILDNNLHGFPWESLPCLEKSSISRLPSLAALRERLLAAKSHSNEEQSLPGHYIRPESGGTSILNPSGDLSHTLKTIKPCLNELLGPWSHIANRAPTEKEFEDSLREQDLVLYFGHGSGAQFVRSKSVRRLYPGQQDDSSRKPGCATTFLFGCSSVHLTENGIYEPSGMLASYLTAGAPAVVGMLWDVTDKDCDRFAVKAGELWGLWPEAQKEAAPVVAPKTPGKRAKSKGRVAQLVDEVEGARAPGSAKKGKKTRAVTEEAEFGPTRRRGLGLDECVREARKACVLRYLNGAAAVVYGIPVYLE
ncbi:peptidase family C50-domain-containing protein [Paraphoma chrysanthemicola]|nr:peptidase family C50-domain-containing protein [Paraphoma chrysanthemicola]